MSVDHSTAAPPHLNEDDPRAAFARELLAHRGHLYRVALLRTRGNHCDAEDLVHETVERAYRGMHGFTPGTNMRAWLMRILINTSINTFHKRSRDVGTAADHDFSELQAARAAVRLGCAPARSAEDEVLARIPGEDVRRALLTLSPEFRLTVYLADVEGWDHKEIAEITGVARGTVMSRLSRGRARLRDHLAHRAPRHASAPVRRPSDRGKTRS